MEIFAHISVFEIQNPPPKIGEMVSFETQFNDEKGRTEAANVVYLNRSPLKVVKNSGTKRNSVYANDEQVELKIMPLQNYREEDEDEIIKPQRNYRGIIRLLVIIILLAIAAYFVYQNRHQIKIPKTPQIMNKTLKSCDETSHCYSDKKWRLE